MSLEDVQLLVACGAKGAAHINAVTVSSLLLRQSIDIDVQENNREGYTPLMYAVCSNRLDIVRILLDAGANINAVSEYGECCLRLAVNREREIDINISKTLLYSGCDSFPDIGNAVSPYSKELKRLLDEMPAIYLFYIFLLLFFLIFFPLLLFFLIS